jgi:hypothetical protein
MGGCTSAEHAHVKKKKEEEEEKEEKETNGKVMYQILSPLERKKMMQSYGVRCLPHLAIMRLPTVLEFIVIEYCTPRISFRIEYFDHHKQPATLYITE